MITKCQKYPEYGENAKIAWPERDRKARDRSTIRSKCQHVIDFTLPCERYQNSRVNPQNVIDAITLNTSMKGLRSDPFGGVLLHRRHAVLLCRSCDNQTKKHTCPSYKWQNPLISCDLYMRSAAISIRRMTAHATNTSHRKTSAMTLQANESLPLYEVRPDSPPGTAYKALKRTAHLLSRSPNPISYAPSLKKSK